MTTKQYLRQNYRLNETIQSHKDELARLREMASSIPGGSFDNSGGGGSRWCGDTPQINALTRAIDLERQIQQEIVDMERLQKNIHDCIGAVRDPDERFVLRCRYILFLTWEDTAERMHYSTTQVKRIHGTALQSIVIPEQKDEPI